MVCAVDAAAYSVYEETAPPGSAFGEAAFVAPKLIEDDVPDSSQVLTALIPEPVRVTVETLDADPGLFNENTRYVAPVVGALPVTVSTPPYRVAEESVTVFTFEPKRPNV